MKPKLCLLLIPLCSLWWGCTPEEEVSPSAGLQTETRESNAKKTTTTYKVSLTDDFYIFSIERYVTFSGTLNVTVQYPGDPYHPNDPYRFSTNANSIKGTDAISGTRYTIAGSTTNLVYVTSLPGTLSYVVDFNAHPNDPYVPGDPYLPPNPIRIGITATLDAQGQITGITAEQVCVTPPLGEGCF